MKNPITFRIITKSISLILIISLGLSSCRKSQDTTSADLIRKIEAGINLNVELVFECEDPLVAVDSDKEENLPIELTFNQEKIAHSITGLEVSNGSLYFINVDGKPYKVK